ncbi:MAG: hypothetical protein AAF497_12660, partial [Planctomycetota bacterium]
MEFASTAAYFVTAFCLGKFFSWFVYRTTWDNAERSNARIGSLLVGYLSRPQIWIIHIPIGFFSASGSWYESTGAQGIAVAMAWIMALNSVLRFGAADQNRYYIADRILTFGLASLTLVFPGALILSVLASSCLQYSASASRIGPGYSNLLGFEFVRGSACVLCTCAALAGAAEMIPISIEAPDEGILLAAFLGYQASYYVNQGFAKAALGKHWFEWPLKNRLECLIINSYLRGWGSRLISQETVLQLARIARKGRVIICGGCLLLEAGCIIMLFHSEFAIALLAVLICFHLSVALCTGLLGHEFILNHLVIIGLILCQPELFASVFGIQTGILLVGCGVLNFIFVGLLRLKSLKEFNETGAAVGPYARAADSADLLMAWWDSPYMRMYTYTAITKSGNYMAIPVPML